MTNNNSSVVGKIKSLALLDFLTYDELKYIPGDYLNLIIGPNGTGKSTIVAGIVLGCGGKPALIARSKNVADYVKNGKTKARIELEIVADSSGRVKNFQRSFDRSSKDNYKIDGKKVTAKEYLIQIQKFNIQVDNLCMFLPQDRVQDFTKLNPQELLSNTMTSVCKKEIKEAFDKLIDLRKDQNSNSKGSTELKKQLDDHKRRNENLKVQIESNKRKDELIENEKVLLTKKAYLEVRKLKEDLDGANKDLDDMKKKLDKKEAELKPLEEEQKRHANEKSALQNAISSAGNSIMERTNEFNQLQDSSSEVDSSFNRLKQNLRNISQSVQDQKSQINELRLLVEVQRGDLQQAEEDLANQGDVKMELNNCEKEIAQIRAKIEQLMHHRSRIVQNLEETIQPGIRVCQKKINDINDTARQKAESLRSLNEDAYRAYEWLKVNKHNFKSEVFFPPIIELTVKNKAYAKYIENTVATRDLVSFICTDKEDARKLFDKFRKEMKLNVNIATVELNHEILYHAQKDISEFPKNLGLHSYLIDVIDGPASVINHLCKISALHQVAIGDDKTFQRASLVPPEIKLFFSTNHRFVVQTSRYSGERSMMSAEIQARNILNVGVDPRAREQEQNNLRKWQGEFAKKQEELKRFESQISNHEVEVNNLKGRKANIQKLVQKVQAVKEKLKKKEIELKHLIAAKIDVAAEQEKFKKNVDDLVVKKLQLVEKQIVKLAEIKKCSIAKILAQKKFKLFDHNTGNIDEKINEIINSITSSRRLVVTIQSSRDSFQRKFDAKKKEVLEFSGGRAPTDRRYPQKDKFDQLTENLGELQNMLEELQGRIACIPGVDPSIVREYEERCQQIELLERNIAQEMNRQANLEQEMKHFHDLWYPEIVRIVKSINENFSKFFSKMGFVGEVELIFKDERDYADYGIQIRVQYRDNEKLQVLNRHVQSGGERAVAIAVYTLSLQHLTQVPFRCVDEINQGMDPKNERKIFQMLVDITCRPGQSQYFFVTPKLLPDLPYNDLMTVSVVHNGEFIDDSFMFLNNEDIGEQNGSTQVVDTQFEEEEDLDMDYD